MPVAEGNIVPGVEATPAAEQVVESGNGKVCADHGESFNLRPGLQQ
jgi:hypothetical protein